MIKKLLLLVQFLIISNINSIAIAIDLKNLDEHISYSLGVMAAEHAKSKSPLGIKVNSNAFIQGFKDNLNNKQQLDQEQIIKYLNIIREKELELQKKYMDKTTKNPANPDNKDLTKNEFPKEMVISEELAKPKEFIKKIVKELDHKKSNQDHEKEKGKKKKEKEISTKTIEPKITQDKIYNEINVVKNFLQTNKKNKSINELKSGLQYQVLNAGNQSARSPLIHDKVKVHYRGTLVNGNEFDNSYNKNPAVFELKSVIKGWQEALTLMKPNAKWKIFVPPQLAYGNNEIGAIPANSILIFEIELIEINPS